MSRDVKSIRHDVSLRDAARMLLREQISGLVVVDHHGHCIGVLSAMDFVRWIQKEGATVFPPCQPDPDFWAEWREENLTRIPQEEVRRHMTVDVVTSPPQGLLSEVARQMLDAHIHRVIVVDERGQPLGIVSSSDLLAAVAYASPEAKLRASGINNPIACAAGVPPSGH
jgi:CBS domain-containing protein